MSCNIWYALTGLAVGGGNLVQEAARLVLRSRGGHGAVREAAELVLTARNGKEDA